MPRQPIDGPLKPPGPIYPPKQPKPSKTTANYESAVLAMVDDVNKPTVATVYINNTLPPDDGYSIPSSMGVTFKAAPAAWNSSAAYNPGDYASVNAIAYKCVTANTNSKPPNANWTTPSGVAFWNDPVLLDGGSWVTVDTVNKVIVSIQEGESNSPPVNPSDLFQYIRHNGAYNTTGNFVNPGPIDTTQLVTGSLSLTPNITNVGTLTMGAAGNGTTDFTVTSFQVDSVGTTGTSKWLAAIYLVASLTGQNKWGIYGALSPDASGTYTGTWGGVGSGNNAYDLGIVYVDLIGNISNVGVLYTNRAPNTLWASLPRIAGSPTFTATGLAVTYAATSPNNYNINVAFTTTAPQYCAQIVVYLTNHGSATPIMYQYIPVTGTGSGPASVNVNTAFTNLPDGTQTYDIYGQYVAVDGEQTTAGNIYTTSAFTSPPPGSGGSMPANTTPSVNTINFVTSNGWTETVELTFNLATAQTTATWLHSLELIYRPTNISYVPYGTTYAAGATSLTVYWPFYGAGGNPSASSTITISGYDASHVFHSESLTVSAVGTPTTGSSGFTTNTLTVSALVNNYNTSINVTYSSSTWVSTGTLLPANTGASYTGLWTVPGFCDLGVYLVDYTGGRSNPSVAMYSQGRWIRTLNNIGSGAVGLIPNFNAGSITYANGGNGAYDALSSVAFDGVGTINNPWLLDLEILTSASTVSTTLSANATQGTNTCTVTSATGLAVDQEIILGGTIEHNTITGISGTTVTVANNWNVTHTSGATVTANAWKHYGLVAPNTSGTYTLDWISLGAGTSYVLGVRYIDTNGGRSWTGTVGTTAANPIVTTTTNMPKMPTGATISVSSVAETLYEHGMHTLLASPTTFSPYVEVSFTLGDTNNPNATNWASHFVGYVRQNGTTSWGAVEQAKLTASSVTNGSTQTVRFGVTPGFNYDFAVLLADSQGNLTNGGTPVTLATNYSVPKVASGSPVGPIWSRLHHLPVSTDPTNGTWNNSTNTFDRGAHHPSLTNVIDSSSNILNVEFHGGKLQQDESLTNVDNVSSATTFPLANGQVISASADIAKGTATGISGIKIGYGGTNDAYYLQFYNGGASLAKVVGGVGSTIGSTIVLTNDTSYHTFRITVSVGATNTIEGSIDGHYFSATDSSIALNGAIMPVTLYTGGASGKVQHFHANATTQHYGNAPIQFKHVVGDNGGNGQLNANPTGGVTGNLPHANHSTQTQSVVATAADTNGSYLQHSTIYDAHVASVKLDTINDGTTYARVHSTAITSGDIDLALAGVRGSTPRKNLVVNGNNCNGTGAIAPSSYGWTGFLNSGTVVSDTGVPYGPYGANASFKVVTTAAYSGPYQAIPVNPGATYTFAALLYNATAGANPYVLIRSGPTSGTQFNVGGVTTVGTPSQFYSESTSAQTAANGITTTGSWQMVYGSFTIPVSAAYNTAYIEIIDNSGGAAATFYFDGVMVIEGNRLQDYIDHEPNAGGVHFARHLAGNIGQSQYDGTTILTSVNSDGSGIGSSQISTRTMIAGAATYNKIAGTSVSGTQVFPACYSTQLTNVDDSGTTWADSNNASIAGGTTLTNGEVIHYNTGSANYAYPPALNPRQTSYTCPASGSITCVFRHVAFSSGGSGVPRVYFTGTTAGGSSTTNTTTNVSGSQNVTWWASGTLPGTVNYGQTNGTAQSYSVTTSVAPSATNPVSLNLTSINCPSDTDGSSSLTIKLIAPDGSTIINTWTGITATSWSYSYQTGTYGSGQYTWQIQAIANNLRRSADSPYNSSYTATYSGTAGYAVTTGASGNTYVLALDGSTQRLNALDGNIKFTQLAPDTVAFQVSNSAASALSFSVGVDVTGV